KGLTFSSAFNRLEQHPGKQLPVGEPLQPDLAQQPRVFPRIRGAAFQRKCDCGSNEVYEKKRQEEDYQTLETRRISRFRMIVFFHEVPDRSPREHEINEG